MQISNEGKARLIVLPIVVMLVITMPVAGYQQREENDVSLDQQIDAQEVTGLSEDNEDVSENYTTREPIRIDGNEDFAEKAEENGWPGDGSKDDPYVIEGYEIDGGGHESSYQSIYTEDNLPYEYGIYIGNVTDHFVIRECYIYNVTGKSLVKYHSHHTYTPPGIFLFNSENGRIEKNKINSSIALVGSTHNVITKNTIRSVNNSSFDGHGITLCPSDIHSVKNSGNNNIINNTIYNKTIGITQTTLGTGPSEESSPAENNIENNTFVNVEVEFRESDSTYSRGNNIFDNDSWFQTRSFYYIVILLGVSLVILGVGWRRVKKEEKDEG